MLDSEAVRWQGPELKISDQASLGELDPEAIREAAYTEGLALGVKEGEKQGKAKFNLGDHMRALDVLTRVLESDPTHLEALTLIIKTYEQREKWPEAVAYRQRRAELLQLERVVPPNLPDVPPPLTTQPRLHRTKRRRVMHGLVQDPPRPVPTLDPLPQHRITDTCKYELTHNVSQIARMMMKINSPSLS